MSIVLNPETEREPASVHMAFDPTEAQGGGFLPLYDESLPLPRLLRHLPRLWPLLTPLPLFP